jgi:hypothetical protein
VKVLRPSYRLSPIDPIVVGSSSGICQRTQARLETLLSANNTCKNVKDAPAPNTWAVDMASEQKSCQLYLYELQICTTARELETSRVERKMRVITRTPILAIYVRDT